MRVFLSVRGLEKEGGGGDPWCEFGSLFAFIQFKTSLWLLNHPPSSPPSTQEKKVGGEN